MKKTAFTELLGIELPIIAAPMFLVSNEDLVVAASDCGGLGTFPSLNYRPAAEFKNALVNIKSRTKKPIGVNIIVNKSNLRQNEDLKIALDLGVELFVTSLGSPKTVIQEAHKNKSKVFCDVINLEQALKVQDLGADGVIAVCAGAGGHAGPQSPFALIPKLKEKLKIPVIVAGAISHGSAIAASLALGASGVSIGTRFIASKEAKVDESYKEAICKAEADDIVMTTRISGTPAAVINTDYIKKIGTDLPWILKALKDNPKTKKATTMFIHWLGSKTLEKSAGKSSWKNVWSAGQSVTHIDSVLSVEEIFKKLIKEYNDTFSV